MNKILIFTLLIICALSNQMTSNYAVLTAQINMVLPNLKFDMGNGNYIRLSNGLMSERRGPFVAASLNQKILNADFNGDSYPDAAVLLHVVYDGIGYWNNILFVVLQNFSTGPKPTNGVVVGEVAIG